jgi:two-component system chemotaxis response regulator CheY
MKCVVVDPLPLMRRILVNFVRACGCEEIATAEDGPAALEACDAETSLLITAWNLPGMDGVELTRKLRETEETAKVRVLIVTPRNSREDLALAREAGVNAYVLKPFSPELLRSRIERLLAEKTDRAEGREAA